MSETARLSHAPQRLYFGWVILATLSLTETTSWGIIYYGFSVFLPYIEGSTHWTRAETTGAFSLALGLSGLAAIPVGRWLDRHGARALMTAGSALASLLLLVLSRVESLDGFYLVWAGLGLAMASVLYDPAFAVLAQWFARYRHRALTILTLAAGLASTIFNPLVNALIQWQGWREALVILAVALALLTFAPHALFLRRRPADLGLAVDGEPEAPHPAAAPIQAPSLTARESLRTPTFWALTLALVLSMFASVAITVHLIPLLIERGYSVSFAAFAIGLIGAMQLPGRVLFAPLYRWLSRRAVTVTISVLQCAALLLLWRATDLPAVLAFVALFGMGNGMATLARASLVAEFFGSTHYGSISGWIGLFTTAARALGPIGAGLIFTVANSYTPVLWTLIGVTFLAGVSFYLADRLAAPLDGEARGA